MQCIATIFEGYSHTVRDRKQRLFGDRWMTDKFPRGSGGGGGGKGLTESPHG